MLFCPLNTVNFCVTGKRSSFHIKHPKGFFFSFYNFRQSSRSQFRAFFCKVSLLSICVTYFKFEGFTNYHTVHKLQLYKAHDLPNTHQLMNSQYQLLSLQHPQFMILKIEHLHLVRTLFI